MLYSYARTLLSPLEPILYTVRRTLEMSGPAADMLKLELIMLSSVDSESRRQTDCLIILHFMVAAYKPGAKR